MGDLKVLESWTQHSLEDRNSGQGSFYYFTRKMKTGAACLKSYLSHIFIQAYRTQNEMMRDWKRVNYYIAMRYQSKVKEIIEKSNFYLCFFVAENVSIKIRNEIEGDSFCAKKYIFLDNYKTWQEYLQEIENKIFRLHVPVSGRSLPKLRKIKMQNFRGYAGNITIDFSDSRKKAASFVAVYAKNGVGKTSLFDAVEYALKGEIGRIVSLAGKDKKNKLKGPIYHNRDCAKKNAYVSMVLDNGKEVLRSVAKATEGGNDCKIVPVKTGKEITGTKDQKDMWNQTILPHDKIDSFISAKTPTEQYKEWIDTAAPLKDQTAEFEQSYAIYRKSELELQKVNDACEIADSKRKEISKLRGAVDRFINLINLYNKVAEADKKLYFQETHTDAGQYNEVLNLAAKYSREVNREKLALDGKISVAEEALDSGISSCLTLIDSSKQTEKTVEKLEIQLQRKKEQDILQQEDRCCLNKLVKYRQEFELLQNMTAYGIDKVKENFERYCRIEKETDELKKKQSFFEKEQQEALDLNRRTESKIKEIELSILSEKEFEEVCGKAKDLDELKEKIQQAQAKENAEKEKMEQYQKSMTQVKKSLDEVRSCVLPIEVAELNVSDIIKNCSFLDEEMRLQLFELEEKYRDFSVKTALFQEEISIHEKDDVILREISEKGMEYLNLHRDVAKCPLCHTPFGDWKTLFLRINNVREEKDDLLNERIKQNQEDLKRIKGRYAFFQQEYEEIRQGHIADLVSQYSELEKKINICAEEKAECGKNRKVFEHEFMEQKVWFIQKNIHLTEWSFAEVQLWRRNQEETFQFYKKELEESVKRKISVQKSIDSIRESVQKLAEQKTKIASSQELYRFIGYFMKQPETFDCQAQLRETEIRIKEIERKHKQLQRKMDEYKDIEGIDPESITKLRDAQIESLEKSRELRKKYSIFETLSEEGIKASLNSWIQKKNEYEQQDEYLKQISEESSARHYFEDYQKCCLELEIKRAEYECQKVKRDIAERDFEEKKKALERGMRSYFNQSSMNEIFKKINPHDFMKNVEYHLSFNAKDEPQMSIYASESDDERSDSYRPEWYFSTAQLNTVAFSSFFSRALAAGNSRLGTIFIDDPIGHFDDMNVLGFTDLLRSIFEANDCQVIMSTHDEKVFRLLERKLDDEYYSACFIQLPEDKAVEWKE